MGRLRESRRMNVHFHIGTRHRGIFNTNSEGRWEISVERQIHPRSIATGFIHAVSWGGKPTYRTLFSLNSQSNENYTRSKMPRVKGCYKYQITARSRRKLLEIKNGWLRRTYLLRTRWECSREMVHREVVCSKKIGEEQSRHRDSNTGDSEDQFITY